MIFKEVCSALETNTAPLIKCRVFNSYIVETLSEGILNSKHIAEKVKLAAKIRLVNLISVSF